MKRARVPSSGRRAAQQAWRGPHGSPSPSSAGSRPGTGLERRAVHGTKVCVGKQSREAANKQMKGPPLRRYGHMDTHSCSGPPRGPGGAHLRTPSTHNVR